MAKFLGFLSTRRPILRFEDGAFSVEDLVTVRVGNEWMNVPTTFGSRRVSPEEAVELLRSHNWVDPESGRGIERFSSWGEAQRNLLQRRLEAVDEFLRHGFEP